MLGRDLRGRTKEKHKATRRSRSKGFPSLRGDMAWWMSGPWILGYPDPAVFGPGPCHAERPFGHCNTLDFWPFWYFFQKALFYLFEMRLALNRRKMIWILKLLICWNQVGSCTLYFPLPWCWCLWLWPWSTSDLGRILSSFKMHFIWPSKGTPNSMSLKILQKLGNDT